MKTDLFQSCGYCLVSHSYWHIECSTFTASSFNIWNSSTGIPSLPLALFIVMLPKVHVTSHSKMFGSSWVITPSWLSGSLKPFLYSSLYSGHLFCLMVECKCHLSVVGRGPQHVSPSLWKLMISLYVITRSFSWQDPPGLEWAAPGWFSSLVCHSFVLPVPTPNSHLGIFHGAPAPTPGLSSADASACCACPSL